MSRASWAWNCLLYSFEPGLSLGGGARDWAEAGVLGVGFEDVDGTLPGADFRGEEGSGTLAGEIDGASLANMALTGDFLGELEILTVSSGSSLSSLLGSADALALVALAFIGFSPPPLPPAAGLTVPKSQRSSFSDDSC